MDAPTAITVAAIAAIGTIAAAATQGFLRIRELGLRLRQAENEIRFQRDALDITAFIGDWDGVMSEIKSLMQDTGIERFLILRAWNGYLEPRWTSAIFQLHREDTQMMSYIHVELDHDYVDRLRSITTAGPVIFTTADISERSLIRGIYETEGIQEAMWCHIESLSVPGTSTKAVTYCSFGARTLGAFDVRAITRANLVVGRLKGIAGNFRTEP
jgi:hypothetical protein